MNSRFVVCRNIYWEYFYEYCVVDFLIACIFFLSNCQKFANFKSPPFSIVYRDRHSRKSSSKRRGKKWLVMCHFSLSLRRKRKYWMEIEYIVAMVLGSVFVGYVVTSLILFRFPTILHKKKRLCFRPAHISHRGGTYICSICWHF